MRRFGSIEGARGVAATGVLAFHVGAFTGGTLGALTDRLWLGVPFFFVISGFLLYRPFAHTTIHGAPPPSLRRYARSRLLRIVPAYWLVTTVTLAVDHAGVWRAVSSYLLVSLPAGKWAVVPPAWTLCIEAAFYLALPAIAIAAGRLAWRTDDPGERAKRLAVVLGLAFPISAVYFATAGTSLSWAHQEPALLPGFIDLFAVGMLLAVAVEHRPTISRRTSRLLLGAAVVLAVAANVVWFEPFAQYGAYPDWVLSRAMAVAFALLLASVIMRDERTLVGRLLSLRVVQLLGSVSYGIYLWHWFFLTRVEDARLHLGAVGDLAAVFVFSVVAASASWLLLERPLLRLKGRPASRPAAVQAAVTT